MAALFYITTSNARDSHFSTSSLTLVVLWYSTSIIFIFIFYYSYFISMMWHLIVISTCIFLMTNDSENPFGYFLTICISSEKRLLKSFAHFKPGYLSFPCWVIGVHYPWYRTPIRYCKYFLPFCGLSFYLFTFLILVFRLGHVL